MVLQPYLFFGGTCTAALDLYKTIFSGTADIMRYGDMPPQEQMPGADPALVMHASFKGSGIAFMASDGRPGAEYKGNNVSLSIATADLADGERIFTALADGATDVMPLQKMFWGQTFGQLTDRYGIDWMFNLG